jgi:hypothetical protein
MEIVGRLKIAKAAELLAERLVDRGDRAVAEKTLIALRGTCGTGRREVRQSPRPRRAGLGSQGAESTGHGTPLLAAADGRA